jgi:3-oxoacyl-[acyl-carrier protein] reductase
MSQKTALITGVGRRRGIGATIALELAGAGWDVAFTYWTPYDQRMPWGEQPDDPRSLVDDLTAIGIRALAIPADLSEPATAARLVKDVADELGPVSALALSYAESVDSGILNTTLESFDRHFAVNVRASWQLIAEFARQVPASGGRIVALTSDHVVDNLPYGASKGALNRIVIAAARELAHLGITSNLINPGPVDTGWMTDEVRERLTALQPTGALGTPQDTANLVAFLLSDKGGWISGQLLKSDGGFSV